MDILQIIQLSTSSTKQEYRHSSRRNRSARLRRPTFKCSPPAVEPRPIPSPSSSFTDYESDFSINFLLTFSKKEGVIDFNDSINSITATDSNSDYIAASNIDPISSSEKFGVTNSVLSITASTSVSTLHVFCKKTFQMFYSKFSSDSTQGNSYSFLAYTLFQSLSSISVAIV